MPSASKVPTAGWIVLAVDLVIVISILFLDTFAHVPPPTSGINKSAIIGWLGVFGAVFIFGGYGILIKTPAITQANVHAVIFQVYYSFGVCACSMLIWLVASLLKGTTPYFQFTPWGVVFALLWVAEGVLGFVAIEAIGYAVAPSMWAGLTIVISFLWGVLSFGQVPASGAGSAAALAALCLGICVVSSSTTDYPERICGADGGRDSALLSHVRGGGGGGGGGGGARGEYGSLKRDDDYDSVESGGGGSSSSGSVDHRGSRSSAVAIGIFCAINVGVLNGSLMMPLKCFDKGGCALFPHPYEGPAGLAAINFLPSLCIGLALVTPAAFLAFYLLKGGDNVNLHFGVAALPGTLTGVFWACGNFASFYASVFLGQTIGFPLTQTCICVNCLWGVYYYGEIKGRSKLLFLAAGVATIIVGACLDGLFAG